MARRRHSVRHRKRKHNRTRSKRGGQNTDEIKEMEEGRVPKTEGRVTNIQFFDPTKINNDSVEYKLPGPTTKEEVDDFFSKPSFETIQKEKRAKADEEFVALSQKYKDDAERKQGIKAYEESLKNPMTASELFSKPAPYEKSCEDDETGVGCPIMGGRKSRRHRRKSRRTRKSRRHRSKH